MPTSNSEREDAPDAHDAPTSVTRRGAWRDETEQGPKRSAARRAAPAQRSTAPWDRPYPAPSYSESQDRRRRQCARAHYFAVFAAHRGWEAPLGSESWMAYRLKCAVPLTAAVGIAVHEAASHCVRALRAGAPLPSFDVLYAGAARALNARWRSSQRARAQFLRTPARIPMYLEVLYAPGPMPAALDHARQRLVASLQALHALDELWAWVRSAAPEDVQLMPSFTSVVMLEDLIEGGVICYGAADLLVRPTPDAPWHIVDFKSGSADGVIDQLFTYALVVRDALGLDVSDGARGVVVALRAPVSEQVASVAITPDDIEEAAARIRRNVAAAWQYVQDPAMHAPRPRDAFPQTTNARVCRCCAFRGLCFAALSPFGPASDSDATR